MTIENLKYRADLNFEVTSCDTIITVAIWWDLIFFSLNKSFLATTFFKSDLISCFFIYTHNSIQDNS